MAVELKRFGVCPLRMAQSQLGNIYIISKGPEQGVKLGKGLLLGYSHSCYPSLQFGFLFKVPFYSRTFQINTNAERIAF